MGGSTGSNSENSAASSVTNIYDDSFARSVAEYNSMPFSPVKPSSPPPQYTGTVKTRRAIFTQFQNQGYGPAISLKALSGSNLKTKEETKKLHETSFSPKGLKDSVKKNLTSTFNSMASGAPTDTTVPVPPPASSSSSPAASRTAVTNIANASLSGSSIEPDSETCSWMKSQAEREKDKQRANPKPVDYTTRKTVMSDHSPKTKSKISTKKSETPGSGPEPYREIINSITPKLAKQFPMFSELKNDLEIEQDLLQRHQSRRTLKDVIQTWLNKGTEENKRTHASAFVTYRISLSQQCNVTLRQEDRKIPLRVAKEIKTVLFDTPLDDNSSENLLQRQINQLSRKTLDPQAQYKATLLGKLANDIKKAASHDQTLDIIRLWRAEKSPDGKTYAQHIEQHRNTLFSFFSGRTRSAELINRLWAEAAQAENKEKQLLQDNDPVAVALHAVRTYIGTHQNNPDAAAKVVALQDLITDILLHRNKTELSREELSKIIQNWKTQSAVLGKGQNNQQLISHQSYISSIFSKTTECSRLIATLETAALARTEQTKNQIAFQDTYFGSGPIFDQDIPTPTAGTKKNPESDPSQLVNTHRSGATAATIKAQEEKAKEEAARHPFLWGCFPW